MNPVIHPTAVIHPGAQIGSQTRVGEYAVVEPQVIIGQRCCIGAHAVIKRYTRMGDDNRIHEGAILGGIPQDLKYRERETGLRIGHHNVFREGVTVHRSAIPGEETVIGDHNYLMAYAHVAHNCILENQVVMANNVLLAGHVLVESRAFISGGVVIHQFCRVGRCSMLGGLAKVVQDVLPFTLVDGSPARTVSLNQVGLRRAGFSRAEIAELKRACRIMMESGGRLESKITRLREFESQQVRHLLAFIEKSKRGFCRPGRG